MTASSSEAKISFLRPFPSLLEVLSLYRSLNCPSPPRFVFSFPWLFVPIELVFTARCLNPYNLSRTKIWPFSDRCGLKEAFCRDYTSSVAQFFRLVRRDTVFSRRLTPTNPERQSFIFGELPKGFSYNNPSVQDLK